MLNGFLVVESSVPRANSLGIGTYKGLYRTPAWSQKAYEAGFDDPLVFGNYTNSDGFIMTLTGARKVKDLFRNANPTLDLEVIWIRETGSTDAVPHASTFLGIDIASKAPFWSVIADPPSDPFVNESKSRLNANALFEKEEDARRYLHDYRSNHPDKNVVFLTLWDVYGVNEAPPEDTL
jgi:hypothetical protein